MRSYATDVAVLARKDLTLELRARDTLPAMLLFVVSALVVFHFALTVALVMKIIAVLHRRNSFVRTSRIPHADTNGPPTVARDAL